MLQRAHSLLWPYDGPAPEESRQLERDGHCVLRCVFGGEDLRALRAEICEVYAKYPGDQRASCASERAAQVFRYQMFNRSALSQKAIGNPRILAVVEPLIGGDCHAINCTAWRNPPGCVDPASCYWHIDGGPHLPRKAGLEWPDSIPYPIFVIGTHIYLDDCGLDEGPTAVAPGSHRSGQQPPFDRRFDAAIPYQGRAPVVHVAAAGDVGFFVSDVWHRRSLPTQRSAGRFFLQTNYGRRDIAQRILPTSEANQVGESARARARTERERTLIGLHAPAFYDG